MHREKVNVYIVKVWKTISDIPVYALFMQYFMQYLILVTLVSLNGIIGLMVHLI